MGTFYRKFATQRPNIRGRARQCPPAHIVVIVASSRSHARKSPTATIAERLSLAQIGRSSQSFRNCIAKNASERGHTKGKRSGRRIIPSTPHARGARGLSGYQNPNAKRFPSTHALHRTHFWRYLLFSGSWGKRMPIYQDCVLPLVSRQPAVPWIVLVRF